MTLFDRHIVISSGGSGIEAQIAVCFAAENATISIIERRYDALQTISEETGALSIVADVTDRAASEKVPAKARARSGPITISITNAGAAPSALFQKISEADFASIVSVNLGGVFNLWQAILPHMKNAGRGQLIAIASTAGLKGYGYISSYCAAKHGVIDLTHALAQELATSGVTTNAICPGCIKTPLLKRSIEQIMQKTDMTLDDAKAPFLPGNAQKRFIRTQELAGTALWLCSDAAASVNGHAPALSGGEI